MLPVLGFFDVTSFSGYKSDFMFEFSGISVLFHGKRGSSKFEISKLYAGKVFSCFFGCTAGTYVHSFFVLPCDKKVPPSPGFFF